LAGLLMQLKKRMIFEHKTDIILPDIPSITGEDGRRHYTTPEGKQYPSVTTVLKHASDESAEEDRQAIEKWKERVGHEEARRVTRISSVQGNKVHKMCEDYLNNLTDPMKGQMPFHTILFRSLKPILDQNITKVYAQEVPLYSDALESAGRADLIAEWVRIPSIIDFKTKKRPQQKRWIHKYFLQESAYAVMFEELTEIPIEQLVVLVAVEGDEPQVFVDKTRHYTAEYLKVRRQYEELT